MRFVPNLPGKATHYKADGQSTTACGRFGVSFHTDDPKKYDCTQCGVARRKAKRQAVTIDAAVCEALTPSTKDEQTAEMFDSTERAAGALEANFTCKAGVYRRKSSVHTPTQTEIAALGYLCGEWDFGYEAETTA